MKKKRSKASRQGGGSNVPKQGGDLSKENGEEQRGLKSLPGDFGSRSIGEADEACREANGDANKGAEMLEQNGGIAEDQSTASSTSDSTSGSSEVFVEAGYGKYGGARHKGKGKKFVAAAGTVSTMLGKDYVRSVSNKSSMKSKDFKEEWKRKEEYEQFLCSMLGEDCELSMAVVRDVFCECGYDVEKALNILLELSACSTLKSKNGEINGNVKEDSQSLFGSTDSFTESISDSTSHSSESDLYARPPHRNHSKVIGGTEAYSSKKPGNSCSELPQEVLESLFSIPRPKNAEHEPNTMDWKKVLKKLTVLRQKAEPCPVNGRVEHHADAKGDEYQVFRQVAQLQWESMSLCYQKAATAYANGKREYASYLSDQGRLHNKIAQEADEKASRDIFIARNKGIENMITIDLHGQHVKQAINLLKGHLVFGAYMRSVQSFRIITGCGSHGLGKSKLKLSVTNLLEKEGIQWKEENRGTLLVKLDGQTEFNFMGNDSDDD